MDADCDSLAGSDSILVTGPAPDRYNRAGELLGPGPTVIAPSNGISTETLNASTVVPAIEVDTRALIEVGIGLSRRVDELTAPDVLLDLTRLGSDQSGVPLSMFRFLLLVRQRVTATGGRLVCTLDGAVDPAVRQTFAELVDRTVRLEATHDWRTAGGLSP
ncbi:hypothetical protein [Natranaeroarchaeum sulfidigenes]|uniref:Uncharacterized protein n=1 Tax=Natranaeroarchaeum sulfidigenes TaxID=2784880 RepID=A0A897MVS7_9EURY|nr:hypothetical protein [Natranaeroarchaeum sulfidigenes]QSG02266.1 hypothetical protein AArcS_1045 [Natranaeroarchaeum sulfidigenes]